MPKQSEIDRTLVLFYKSNNAHDYINYSRPIGWMDDLPMVGLEELESVLESVKIDVVNEIDKRVKAGQAKYAPKYYNSLT